MELPLAWSGAKTLGPQAAKAGVAAGEESPIDKPSVPSGASRTAPPPVGVVKSVEDIMLSGFEAMLQRQKPLPRVSVSLRASRLRTSMLSKLRGIMTSTELGDGYPCYMVKKDGCSIRECVFVDNEHVTLVWRGPDGDCLAIISLLEVRNSLTGGQSGDRVISEKVVQPVSGFRLAQAVPPCGW